MEELKPCPFCGGEAAVYGVDSYYVACCRCEAQTARYKTAQEAIVNWNRRAAPANEALTMTQLREMDGQPVWVVPNRGVAKWYLVDVANDACETCDMDVVDFELYGPENKSYGWLAYARRPESAP